MLQIVIMVVDSTDRERLTLNKEELHRMLAHEVRLLSQQRFSCFFYVVILTDVITSVRSGLFSIFIIYIGSTECICAGFGK